MPESVPGAMLEGKHDSAQREGQLVTQRIDACQVTQWSHVA